MKNRAQYKLASSANQVCLMCVVLSTGSCKWAEQHKRSGKERRAFWLIRLSPPALKSASA